MSISPEHTPVISDYMSASPATCEIDDSVEIAYRTMSECAVRHLPVVEKNKKLMGLVTERDLRLALSLSGSGTYRVCDIYLPEPYMVGPNALLSQVLDDMYQRHIGSALIVEGGKVIGIFTSMDAVRVLRDFSRR
jgi:CBS domain-containing protein